LHNGGVFAKNDNGGTAVITLKNSLIVGNAGKDVDCAAAGATLASNGHNLIRTQNGAACLMTAEKTALAEASIMGPLQNNGGSTQTHALVFAASNPAVNTGLNADATAAGITTDQRGAAFPRPFGGTVDIGAFELQSLLPPAAPTGLTATPTSATQINLAWTDASSDETGFEIERATAAGGPWTLLTTTAANATSYNDTGLTTGTTYYYRVRATNAGVDSANATANATSLPTSTPKAKAAVGGVAEFITPPVNDGVAWRVVGMMGAGLAMGLGVLGLSRAKKTE